VSVEDDVGGAEQYRQVIERVNRGQTAYDGRRAEGSSGLNYAKRVIEDISGPAEPWFLEELSSGSKVVHIPIARKVKA